MPLCSSTVAVAAVRLTKANIEYATFDGVCVLPVECFSGNAAAAPVPLPADHWSAATGWSLRYPLGSQAIQGGQVQTPCERRRDDFICFGLRHMVRAPHLPQPFVRARAHSRAFRTLAAPQFARSRRTGRGPPTPLPPPSPPYSPLLPPPPACRHYLHRHRPYHHCHRRAVLIVVPPSSPPLSASSSSVQPPPALQPALPSPPPPDVRGRTRRGRPRPDPSALPVTVGAPAPAPAPAPSPQAPSGRRHPAVRPNISSNGSSGGSSSTCTCNMYMSCMHVDA